MITKQEAQERALEHLEQARSIHDDRLANIGQGYAMLALSLDDAPVRGIPLRLAPALEPVEFEEDEGQEAWAG